MMNIKKASPLATLALAGALTGCAPDRVDKFNRGNPYESYGVVSAKEFFPNYDLRRYGLKLTNTKGETFVDDHFVWLVDIPEFPNTAQAINSPSLYNLVAIGDTVDLVLRDHEHWITDSRGNQLSRPTVRTLIQDYSPRTNNRGE